jgi:hypothetical protein
LDKNRSNISLPSEVGIKLVQYEERLMKIIDKIYVGYELDRHPKESKEA